LGCFVKRAVKCKWALDLGVAQKRRYQRQQARQEMAPAWPRAEAEVAKRLDRLLVSQD
jgi:hypothetical protein